MTDDGAPDEPPPRIWADWDQRDPSGRVWTFATQAGIAAPASWDRAR